MKKGRLIFAGLFTLILYAAICSSQTVNYGWEDPNGTSLGSYGNIYIAENINDANYVRTGIGALRLTEKPHSDTPIAYVAFITNLSTNDIIQAQFYGYDTTSTLPSMRIWAHYATSDNLNNNEGSAGGNTTYTSGDVMQPWSLVSHNWLFDSAGQTRDALVIEARVYSTPFNGDYSTDFFVDDLTIIAPDSATVIVPPADNDQCENATGVYLCIPYNGSTSAISNDTGIAWHRFGAPKNGRYVISLAGSDYDTTLVVYDSCGGVVLELNDDYYPDGTSKVLIDLSASQSCYIRIAF